MHADEVPKSKIPFRFACRDVKKMDTSSQVCACGCTTWSGLRRQRRSPGLPAVCVTGRGTTHSCAPTLIIFLIVSPPPVPVPAVISPEASVPAVWDRIDTAFAYVISVRSKCHKVAVGYPQHPREWRSCCGWAFGIADVARPVLSLPACHKLICERCLPVEREAARAESAANVREVGGLVSMQDGPPSIVL